MALNIRVYAIGDIHGCLATLQLLWAEIQNDLEKAPPADHRVIFLGDYIDRGPRSAGVIGWLATLKERDDRIIALRGNHDQPLLDFVDDPLSNRIDIDLWLTYGGCETLTSYDVAPVRPHDSDQTILRCAHELADVLPQQHRQFLERTPLSYQLGGFFFAHAGIYPGAPLEKQSAEHLLWIREPFLSHQDPFEKIVVHGHTPVAQPEVRLNRINVDTGAVFGRALTAAVLEEGDVRFLTVPTDPQDLVK